MATLEKRVQVLFDPATYAELEADARASGRSVGSVIREAVDDHLTVRRARGASALQRLWERADSLPRTGPIDWDEEKSLMERESLRDVP